MDNHEKHILIVDDNLKNLQLTAKLLKDEGYLISLAQSGQAALMQLNQQKPALILLDIMMPEMDGLEVCARIKQDDNLKEIPVIFLTAKNETKDLLEGFNVGGVDYISKPFKREELLIRAKNHLELADSRKKIIEMNKTRDKLYSIIAHDIRSPLANICMVIQSVSDNIITPDSKDFDEIITGVGESANYTLTLLENLLKWTELQSDSIALTPISMDVSPILSDCVNLLKANAEHKKIAVNLNMQTDASAYFDEISIHIVFRNLIANAIKFTPVGGIIKISSSVDAEYLRISIKDNGTGMKEDVMEKIFNKQEIHTTLGTNKEQGTGLGLIVVKDFVEKNNGKLDVNSKLGKGTEVIVSLPIEENK